MNLWSDMTLFHFNGDLSLDTQDQLAALGLGTWKRLLACLVHAADTLQFKTCIMTPSPMLCLWNDVVHPSFAANMSIDSWSTLSVSCFLPSGRTDSRSGL
ncbi:hypothetical protein DACRYDRAFT_20394 [Dacryopinax primogenitus]|uniref:Uncharacterized protein n=1 Tax=Dacryopinax primogenitus (strain DJM 731) TaxID=1858805 RepID=M5G990_DACPD|nr:uncharacterized protein DACRYDRAFT_20394 [Dacryopinax primogenitus]EJU04765.1 hypothetical protein DACRYDRAFT_20394 [Dacryopinax primogenitus]